MAVATTLAVATAAAAVGFGRAEAASFNFSTTLGSGMVLQHPAVLWGWGTPGATVATKVSSPTDPTVAVAVSTTVASDGIWRQPLPNRSSMSGLAGFTITSSSGGQTATLTDVLFGRVIMCSGQSNIETITVSRALNATAEVTAAPAFTHVRLLQVAHDSDPAKQADLRIQPTIPWGPPTAGNIGGFSATCFFVARDLFNELGGTTAVGVVQSACGGTAVRNWAPMEALAKCPQPYNSPDVHGTHPYEHAVLYNTMVHPFATGPAAFSFVVWDQAESDSFPQTPLGYYGCQTVFQINAWRKAFGDSLLPWIFVHLQPYTGSGPCCLEDLRAMQLDALALPQVGFASAIDLGDPSSPYGNVHFQNKQAVSRRLTAVALQLAFGRGRTVDGDGAWPPPSFLTQAVTTSGTTLTVNVTLASVASFKLKLGATVDLLNQSSAVCPATVVSGNCSGFEILSSDGLWHPATASVGSDGKSLILTGVAVGSLEATAPSPPPYAVGSRYAWNAWPLATLFAENHDGSLGLPVLPWSQALTMAAPTAARS